MLKIRPLFLALAVILPAAAQGGGIIHDPRGFSIQVPNGYTPNKVGGDRGLRGASVRAPDGAAAMMLFDDTQGQPPTACLEQCVKAAAPRNSTLVSSKVVSQQPYVVMQEYTYSAKAGPSRVRMMFMHQGPVYRAYFVMAPEPLFAKDEKALDGICNSFQFTRPSNPTP